ncbi:MAG TPA: GNAT family N-acetyltransferase [Planctomycetota bacterium]|nr:GNAT family N-acetyltransferase [Planctomycetota bacterium]
MQSTEPNSMETESVLIRRLRPSDLKPVIAIDAKAMGRRRAEYFKIKLEMAQNETGVEVSLAAELDGMFVGFLIARVYCGDFGVADSTATLEVLGVHPGFRGRGVGHALVLQLTTNLLGLGVGQVSTEVNWNDPSMIGFIQREGFAPAPRFCVDLDCKAFRQREEARD